MGKAALFAIAAFTVMGAIYGLSTSSGQLGTTEAISSHQFEIIARNAAITGFQDAKMRLSDTFSSSSFSGDYESAEYDVSVSVTGTTAEVKSVGTATTSDGRTREFNIVAVLEQITNETVPEEPPPFMQYALMSDQDLALGGSMTLDTVKIEGSELTNLNANVHTNGNLATSGNKLKIRGFGTYKNSEHVTHSSAFDPYNNPTRDAVVKRVEEKVEIPSFSAAAMATRINTYYTGVDSTGYGDVTLSGSYDFDAMGATRENPFIWHVKGNLKTNGNVALKGYVMFLVEGDATFNGNMTAGDRSGKSENSVAIYTDGEVSVGGSVDELWMQAYAKSGVSLDGNSKIYGNVSTSGQVKTTGSPTIKYLPASAALANVFEDPLTRLELLSYREY